MRRRSKYGILSFDVSSVSTGWSYLVKKDLRDYGVVKADKKQTVPFRLCEFYDDVEYLLSEFKPRHVVVEDTYLLNVKTLKTLMQFIGVLNQLSMQILELNPTVISPNTARSVYKLKNKEETFDFIKDKYKTLSFDFKEGNDVTDSILLGLYYYEFVLLSKDKEES